MKKPIVIILVSIIVLGLSGIAYWRYKDVAPKNIEPSIIPENKIIGQQTYINTKFGYSIEYPANWVFREFPDTQTGAGFRPLNSPNEITSECVIVDSRGTGENEYNTPFSAYVKKAAIIEIQGYEKLNSIKSITTATGLIGYETTWIYKDVNGQDKISLPITYFGNKNTIQTNDIKLKYKTVQITLNSKNCEEIYNQMLPTFKLLK
jgi:hypothetical protein